VKEAADAASFILAGGHLGWVKEKASGERGSGSGSWEGGRGEGTSIINLFLRDVNVAAGGHLGWAQVVPLY
jgi:hypothetical protein